jgi:hypothetical protein
MGAVGFHGERGCEAERIILHHHEDNREDGGDGHDGDGGIALLRRGRPGEAPGGFEQKEKSGTRNERRLEQCRKAFNFSVAVAVVFVGGLERKLDGKKGHDGNAGIDHRVDQRGENGGGTGLEQREALDHDQDQDRRHRSGTCDQRHARADVGIDCWHRGILAPGKKWWKGNPPYRELKPLIRIASPVLLIFQIF